MLSPSHLSYHPNPEYPLPMRIDLSQPFFAIGAAVIVGFATWPLFKLANLLGFR